MEHMRIASPPRIVAPAFVAVVALLVSAGAARSQHSDSIVARAASVIAPLRDSAALHRAGFFAIGFGGGVKDLTPFQGQHWIEVRRWFMNPAPEVAKPNFLMYLPIGDSLVPIGAAYTRRLEPSIAPPSDLDGDTVEWHSHVFCRAVPGEGNTLADGTDDCKARGGTPGPREIKMVHVWTIANPDGPYAHDNPALPFIATGLRPPAHASRDDRLFAIAIGESYGARLVIAHRLTILAAKAGKQQGLESWRDTLRALVSELRAAERANDAPKFNALRMKMIDAWNALAAEYRAVAPTPELKARFDVELQHALGMASHDHM
jgi:hypothetical protein